jgi:hypothetical protein
MPLLLNGPAQTVLLVKARAPAGAATALGRWHFVTVRLPFRFQLVTAAGESAAVGSGGSSTAVHHDRHHILWLRSTAELTLLPLLALIALLCLRRADDECRWSHS